MLSALLLPMVLALGNPSSQPASQPGSAAPIQGVIKLGKGFKAKAGSVFILLRTEGSADRGPPIAVLRLDKLKFPLKFTIGSENVMIPGTTFQGPFDLYARLDQDGNPITKKEGDLFNAKPLRVKPGDKKVVVILDAAR